MTSAEAYAKLSAKMKQYEDFGARDSEGLYALERIEEAVEKGKPYPLIAKAWPHDNPWELYQSVPGWEQASAELLESGREYWKAKLAERLGVTITD